MSHIQFIHTYEDIISIDNLLQAWDEFIDGKRGRKDVQRFQLRFMDSILNLHNDLKNQTYTHNTYEAFTIFEPKPRSIHKASVRDRILHRAIYRKLYSHFDRTFISESFSCRIRKGTHRANKVFERFKHIISKNNTKQCYILKCDIKKFFASIDHRILLNILNKYILDKYIINLLHKVIGSFHSTEHGKGLPLGNLTSQLFANVYMNEFDQHIKHKLKAKYYIRYADDFVIFSENKQWLVDTLKNIHDFLSNELKLLLHPNKISIKTISSGVDYLGWVHFPDYRVLRTATKKRMFKNPRLKMGKRATVNSYLGLLGYGNTYKNKQNILKYATFI